MDYLKYLFYGFIQGLTEFLPISSTAHLKILSTFFGLQDPGSSLSAIIQLGSVFALLYFFRKDIFLKTNFKNNIGILQILSKPIIKSIVLATIPILLIGSLIKIFHPNYSDSILRSNISIGLVSIFMAVIMLISEKSNKSALSLTNHNNLNSILIGFAQAFAIVPGVSRSGITISTALLLGWKRKEAAKYSFLLGLPSISIAAVVELLDSVNQNYSLPLGPILLALITTFFTSLFSIKFLINFISLNGLKFFAYYRLFFGILILMFYL